MAYLPESDKGYTKLQSAQFEVLEHNVYSQYIHTNQTVRSHRKPVRPSQIYNSEELTGLTSVIFTVPRCVFRSFSTVMFTVTLSKTAMVTSPPLESGREMV